VALRLAFDLDGVLADMDGALVREAGQLFGKVTTGPAPAAAVSVAAAPKAEGEEDAPAALQLSPRQQHRLWRHIATVDNFWETLAECEEGSVRRLFAASMEYRWETIFLTRRPSSAGLTPQVQSQRWLEANGFEHPSVFVVRGSRGRIAAALNLDFVVDDRTQNCLDVAADSKARPILLWRGADSELPGAARRLGFAVVNTMAECLSLLAEHDRPRTASTRGFGRLKRLLGFREPAKT